MKKENIKKLWIIVPFIAIIALIPFIHSCDEGDIETCEQEEICTGKTVSACCTPLECYYTYNGNRYEDDDASLNQLAVDLGCASASSPSYNDDIASLKSQLILLSEMAGSQHE